MDKRPILSPSSTEGITSDHMRWSLFDCFVPEGWQFHKVLPDTVIGSRLNSWSQLLSPCSIMHSTLVLALSQEQGLPHTLTMGFAIAMEFSLGNGM